MPMGPARQHSHDEQMEGKCIAKHKNACVPACVHGEDVVGPVKGTKLKVMKVRPSALLCIG